MMLCRSNLTKSCDRHVAITESKKLRNWGIRVNSNDITANPNVIKIGKLVQNFKGE
jgi:hypothetical protein